jgi:DNA polymerase-3 subunit delta
MAKQGGSSRKGSSGPNPSQVLSNIEKGEVSPIYFLHGLEEFGKEDLLNRLKQGLVDPATQAFNFDTFQGEDLDISEVVTRVASFPMMAPRRLVVIKRIDQLSDAEGRTLLPYIEAPAPTTTLLLTAMKVDGRKKLFSTLKKTSVSVEFKQPYDNQIPDWIRGRVATMGKEMAEEAVHFLQMSVGTRLPDLANELEKLAIHVGDGKAIGLEDVREIVNASRGASIFELADAMGKRNSGPALSLLKQLVDQGENPSRLVAMLTRHIVILRKARWLQALRLPRADIAGQLRVPPFFLSGYLEQASLFSDEDLWNAYDSLLEADNKLKSRSRSSHAYLSELIVRVCSGFA